ncbi:ATP-binding protein [Anaerotignum sp. MB30-C6]|uniref:ATP-binding protein n=1 Tax=Anaerotignum sp. MB30-C6 TaxID=3070814 RepID=UPI0027DE181B|nr:ATP-binding protein [Anaerotignum sp. MB30-C6]WMI81457.1 ATP-binding protein [Anaerotignum sp. MB30-C6]
MATRTQIFREILREYDGIRTQKAAELRDRKAELYERLPRLEEIERELALLGTKTARMVLQGNMNPEEIVEQLKSQQKILEQERLEILATNHLTTKLFEMEYACPKCKDTGYIGTEQCLCLKRRLMDKLYDQSNVRDIIKVENFDNFDFSLYNTTASKEEGLSPKANAEKLYRRALAFVEEFGNGANLLIYGGTGLGKTFLCNCIAKDLLEKGHTVLYLTAGQLFRKLEEQKFHRDDDEEEAKEWDQELLEAELLIIDDLGTEFATIFTASELFRIINDRKLAKKAVVISTNLGPTELMNLYSDRVTSRFFGEFEQMKFFGDDIRIVKKFQR